jgi:hypothetical protein
MNELERILQADGDSLSLEIGAENLSPKDAVVLALIRLARNPSREEEERAEAAVRAYKKLLKELKDGTAEQPHREADGKAD